MKLDEPINEGGVTTGVGHDPTNDLILLPISNRCLGFSTGSAFRASLLSEPWETF